MHHPLIDWYLGFYRSATTYWMRSFTAFWRYPPAPPRAEDDKAHKDA